MLHIVRIFGPGFFTGAKFSKFSKLRICVTKVTHNARDTNVFGKYTVLSRFDSFLSRNDLSTKSVWNGGLEN